MIRQNLRAAFSANVPLRVKLEMALFIIFFPHVFQILVAFKTVLQFHTDAIENHNVAIRLLDERTAAVWKACMKTAVEEKKTSYIS
jgi:hypothetical protein